MSTLRPEFTQRLLKDLSNGAAINLIGASGQGRWRTLEDCRDNAPNRTKVALLNMAQYVENFPAFLADLKSQLGSESDAQSLGALLDEFNGKVWLLLARFDALYGNPQLDPAYAEFFNHLNSFRNRPGMALVCVTERAHDSYRVEIKDQFKRLSWLNLRKEMLPALTRGEIIALIEQQAPDFPPLDMQPLASSVLASPCPYDWLCEIAHQLANGADTDLALPERLKKWDKAYRRANPRWFGSAVMQRRVDKIRSILRAFGNDAGGLVNELVKVIKAIAPLGKLWAMLRKGKSGEKK
jgi:hypothetical protein